MDFLHLTVISVALSLIICWALFAMLCSYAQEAVAQVLAERGRFMKKYLLQQLQDNSNGINWALLVYEHGTIDLLSRASNKPTNDIAPSLFAQTLIEVVGNVHLVRMKYPEVAEAVPSPLKQFREAIAVLQPSSVVNFYGQALRTATLTGSTGEATAQDGKIYEALVNEIESWYTEMMQRLSYWYKKKIRKRLFIWGTLIGLILNVDSVQLFDFFNKNEDARAEVRHFYEKNASSLALYANRLDSIQHADSAGRAKTMEEGKTWLKSISQLDSTLALPVGFDKSVFVSKPNDERYYWIHKLFGILITGFAVSFGAPFWFDVLKKATSSPFK